MRAQQTKQGVVGPFHQSLIIENNSSCRAQSHQVERLRAELAGNEAAVASSRRLQQNQQSVEVMREKCLVAERRAATADAALAEVTARESAAAAAAHSEAGWAAALTALPGVSSAADVIHQVGELQRAVTAAQAAAVRNLYLSPSTVCRNLSAKPAFLFFDLLTPAPSSRTFSRLALTSPSSDRQTDGQTDKT